MLRDLLRFDGDLLSDILCFLDRDGDFVDRFERELLLDGRF